MRRRCNDRRLLKRLFDGAHRPILRCNIIRKEIGRVTRNPPDEFRRIR